MPWVAERAPEGWRATHQRGGVADDPGYEPLPDGDEEVTVDARKRAWARLLAKVYEGDPMVCLKCGAEMKGIAVIEDPDELKRILRFVLSVRERPHTAGDYSSGTARTVSVPVFWVEFLPGKPFCGYAPR